MEGAAAEGFVRRRRAFGFIGRRWDAWEIKTASAHVRGLFLTTRWKSRSKFSSPGCCVRFFFVLSFAPQPGQPGHSLGSMQIFQISTRHRLMLRHFGVCNGIQTRFDLAVESMTI